ncbi:MAG: hypothetical protein HZA48_01380 [Planctomycetes bacterium]|nr:hypothetical protein [Planctomycetota bacterium]
MKTVNNENIIIGSVRYAANRMQKALFLRHLSRGVLAALAFSLAILLLSRIFYMPYSGLICLTVFSAMTTYSASRGYARMHVNPELAAREIDRKFNLSELVLTSYENTNGIRPTMLSAFAVSSADEFLKTHDIHKAFPLRMPANSRYHAVLLIMILAVCFFPAAQSGRLLIRNAQTKQADMLSELVDGTPGVMKNDLKRLIDAMNEPTQAEPEKVISNLSAMQKNLESAINKTKHKEEFDIALRESAGISGEIPREGLMEKLREKFGKSAPSDEAIAKLRDRLLQMQYAFDTESDKRLLKDSVEALDDANLEKAYAAMIEFLEKNETASEDADMERLSVRLESARTALIETYAKSGMEVAQFAPKTPIDSGFSKFHSANTRVSGTAALPFTAAGADDRYKEIVKRYFSQ